MRTRLLALLLLCGGCSFDPPTSTPTQRPVGATCAADRQCASALCGAAGSCVECRDDAPCGADRACSAEGRCVPKPDEHLHRAEASGVRRTNTEGRVHVGRVGVVPVTTQTERP